MIQNSNKDILAKLMATENITVLHKQVPTAYFDVKSRTLVCPILKGDMSPELTDLFMGHEVGHALNTPADGWHDSVSDKGMIFKGYLNVIEDCRIEKMIKNKYPGLRKSFYSGYRDLANRDFFGLKGKDLEVLNLIDRINIHFKIGSIANVKFTDEEMVYVQRCHKLETFEQVMTLATELFDRQNELNENELESMSDIDIQDMMEDFDIEEGDESMMGDSDQQLDNDEDSDESSSSTDETESSSQEDVESSESDSSEEGEEESEEESDQDSNKSEEGEGSEKSGTKSPLDQLLDEMNKSITDHAFREKESELYKTDHDWSDPEPTYFEIKDKIKYKNYIVDFKEIDKQFGPNGDNEKGLDRTRVSKTVKEFQDSNKKIINYMVKEFEMKKAAAAYKRSWSAKSGELNMDKLHLFQLKDDIFNRVQVTPEGKNHGIVMVLDWSGSMSGTVQNTIEQASLLSMYCRRLAIPFTLFAFSDSYMRHRNYDDDFETIQKKDEYKRYGKEFQKTDTENDWTLGNLGLLEMFSDRMSNTEFTRAMENWFQLGYTIDHGYSYYYDESTTHDTNFFIPMGLHLGGTPLDHSIVVLRDYILDFQRQHNLDICSFITLTDGSSHSLFTRGTNPHIVDRKRNLTMKLGSSGYRSATHGLLNWLKETTGCNTIGFYIKESKPKDVVWDAQNFCDTKCSAYGDEGDIKVKEFRQIATTFNDGCYDLAIIINQKKISINYDEDQLNVDQGANKGALKRALVKAGNNKMKQRVILNQFVEQMAV